MFREHRFRERNALDWRFPTALGGRICAVKRDNPFGICPKLTCKALIENGGGEGFKAAGDHGQRNFGITTHIAIVVHEWPVGDLQGRDGRQQDGV